MSVDLQDKYLPELYKDITDINELMETESTEIDLLWTEVYSLLEECFIDDASQVGVSRWESILNISPNVSETLENRRDSIKLKLYVKNKANFSLLNTLLANYGTVNDISFSGTTSTVTLDFVSDDFESTVYLKVREIVPAHLLLEYIVTSDEITLNFDDNIYGTHITRNTKLGIWQLGTVPFATAGTEVQYK